MFKLATERKSQLQGWLAHSSKFSANKVVKVCEDIVQLLQQKNLLNEFYGKKFVRVGDIELKVGYNMRVTRAAIDGDDFLERKLITECDEGE